jgi:hypothetical protein
MSAFPIFAVPPAEDDSDAYVFIDHREEETSIVEYVSARLSPEDVLEVEEDEEQILVSHQGRVHPIPLQLSLHDRYIMISSLAELLRERYQFFLLRPSLGDDTHGLLVVSQSDVRSWDAVPDYLVALELGYDYFNGIRVPYLNQEACAPDFDVDRSRVVAGKDALGGLVQALFTGKMDANAAAEFARLALNDPEARKAIEGKSDAEVAAEIRQAFNDALASPDMEENRRELDKAMADLKALTRVPPKPWWKIW